MRKLIEGMKDFIYDSVDYFIVLCVVLLVGAIIGWRLPQLFASDLDKYSESEIAVSTDESDNNEVSETDKNTPKDDSSKTIEDNVIEVVEDKSDNSNSDNATDESNSNESNSNESSSNESSSNVSNNNGETITVVIPSGSLSPKIADILKNKGLIDDTNEFLKKAKELKLDRKLRSGDFEIKQGSSLESIIKKIAGRK